MENITVEKSTIKNLIGIVAGSCAAFPVGYILGMLAPQKGIIRKVMYGLGTILIGEVVAEKVTNSETVDAIGDTVVKCLSKKKDISEAAEEETDETPETSEETTENTSEEATDSEPSEEDSDISEESVSFDVNKCKNAAMNIYSAMELAYTYLIARTIFRFFKVKKLLSKIAVIYLSYEILSKLAVRLSVSLLRPDIYMGSKEAIA